MTRTGHVLTALAAAVPLAGLDPAILGVTILGATAPDFDLVLGQGFHRKLTHWWPLWAAGAAVGWVLSSRTGDGDLMRLLPAFAMGGLLHLVGDLLTPMGIPLGINPFRRHKGLGLFVTGSVGEAVFVGLLAAVAFGVWRLGM
jgi:membrane-bound metal-dependent hydrolase YbcI (DUF457 family)